MKLYFTQRLGTREQNRTQYVSVMREGREVCRTDAPHKAERLVRALELLDRVEAGAATVCEVGGGEAHQLPQPQEA